MPHRRNPETLEWKKARRHCLANSFWDPKLHESVYLGVEDDTVAAVNLTLGVKCVPELIPETPQGLVLSDQRGEGLFQ